jgi:glycosyltransferase involved in cell wall biosynthesis
MRMRTGRNRDTKKPKALHAGTSPLSAQWFMRGQLRYLSEAGFDVTVVTAPGPGLDETRVREGVNAIGISMIRQIAPLQDLLSLWRMWRTLRCLGPDIINVGTPKAGLLGGIAAWLNRVPCRVYTLHGLRLETTSGLERRLLRLCERIACACAHRVISVSESLRQEAVAMGIVDAERIKVLASGSCNGVDIARFAPSRELLDRAALVRQELRIPPEAPVLGFVGRLTRDKGIAELAGAFDILRSSFPGLRLLLVGDFEDGDPVPVGLRHRIETERNIIRPGFVKDIEVYYQIMSVLALPTYREGFGNAILEAHAASKPVVATRATGVVDAVVNNVTGLLVPIGNSEALAEGCARLLRDPKLASAMGRAGRERVLHEFRQETVWDALLQEYLELLAEKALPLPGPGNMGTVPAMAKGVGQQSS